MKQTITIDGEAYEVDRTVAGAIDEMQDEIGKLRGIVIRLAVLIDGRPCVCSCVGYTERQEGFVHSKVCRDVQQLNIWPESQ